ISEKKSKIISSQSTDQKAQKNTYEERKKIKSLHNKLSKVEAEINKLEREIKNIDAELVLDYDKTISTPGFFDSYQKKKNKLDELMEKWEALENQIAKID